MNRNAPIRARHRHSAPSKNKLEMLRARCTGDLKDLVTRAAERLDLDEADVIRMGVREFAQRVTQPPSLANLAS